MINNIITAIIALLLGGGSVFLLTKKLNKKTISDIKSIGASESNDEKRSNVIKKADEQIKENNDIIEKAKKLLKKNNEVINDAKENTITD